jgi:hypothetical protein
LHCFFSGQWAVDPSPTNLIETKGYSYSGPGSTGRAVHKRYTGLTHCKELRTARLHCPLLNFLYRHKFTTFVVQTLEQKTTLQI